MYIYEVSHEDFLFVIRVCNLPAVFSNLFCFRTPKVVEQIQRSPQNQKYQFYIITRKNHLLFIYKNKIFNLAT